MFHNHIQKSESSLWQQIIYHVRSQSALLQVNFITVKAFAFVSVLYFDCFYGLSRHKKYEATYSIMPSL